MIEIMEGYYFREEDKMMGGNFFKASDLLMMNLSSLLPFQNLQNSIVTCQSLTGIISAKSNLLLKI